MDPEYYIDEHNITDEYRKIIEEELTNMCFGC